MEGRQHDPPRAPVVGAVDGEHPVAEQRDQVAEAALAPAEVVRVGDGDVVVRLRPEHEHAAGVQDPDREDRPEALVGVEQDGQRIAPKRARARETEVRRARGQRLVERALGDDVARQPAQRVGGDGLWCRY
jgi:hypothetical protein